MINAEEARNKTVRYGENLLDSKLKKIEKLILGAISEGKFECCFDEDFFGEDFIFMDKDLRDKIKEFGYELKVYNYYNKIVYKISW